MAPLLFQRRWGPLKLVLIVFFAALGLLEDVGYMARTAYVMDRYMHWLGLHGKSCMPLILGFGCNVPAILGTRILEDRRSRLLTMMLTRMPASTGSARSSQSTRPN